MNYPRRLMRLVRFPVLVDRGARVRPDSTLLRITQRTRVLCIRYQRYDGQADAISQDSSIDFEPSPCSYNRARCPSAMRDQSELFRKPLEVEKESEVVFKDVTLDCDSKAERQIQDALFEDVERFLGSKFIARNV